MRRLLAEHPVLHSFRHAGRPGRTATPLLLLLLILAGSLSCSGDTDPPEPPSPTTGPYGFLFTSQEEIEARQIATWEDEVVLQGWEITSEGQALIEEGHALVSVLPLEVPLLHPNGWVEITDEMSEERERFEEEETDPRHRNSGKRHREINSWEGWQQSGYHHGQIKRRKSGLGFFERSGSDGYPEEERSEKN